MQQPQGEVRPQEREVQPGTVTCCCPVCGVTHLVPEYGMRSRPRGRMWHMGMARMRMMPMMGMGLVSIVPALLGFMAGYMVGGTCRR